MEIFFSCLSVIMSAYRLIYIFSQVWGREMSSSEIFLIRFVYRRFSEFCYRQLTHVRLTRWTIFTNLHMYSAETKMKYHQFVVSSLADSEITV